MRQRLLIPYEQPDRLRRTVWCVDAEMHSGGNVVVSIVGRREEVRPTTRHKWVLESSVGYARGHAYPKGQNARTGHGVYWNRWVDTTRAFGGTDFRGCNVRVPAPEPPADLIERLHALFRPTVTVAVDQPDPATT